MVLIFFIIDKKYTNNIIDNYTESKEIVDSPQNIINSEKELNLVDQDGIEIRIIQVGKQSWMKNNLNVRHFKH